MQMKTTIILILALTCQFANGQNADKLVTSYRTMSELDCFYVVEYIYDTTGIYTIPLVDGVENQRHYYCAVNVYRIFPLTEIWQKVGETFSAEYTEKECWENYTWWMVYKAKHTKNGEFFGDFNEALHEHQNK